jgi:hypothetical protein
MSGLLPWFSDAPQVPDPLPYCLVCWAYGNRKERHW